MAIQARNKPEDYPGVVEQGLELAEFVLTNRARQIPHLTHVPND